MMGCSCRLRTDKAHEDATNFIPTSLGEIPGYTTFPCIKSVDKPIREIRPRSKTSQACAGDMDWTGGARNRYAATKRKTIAQKQKAHFAKARAALQATPSSTIPFQPAYLLGSRRKDKCISDGIDSEVSLPNVAPSHSSRRHKRRDRHGVSHASGGTDADRRTSKPPDAGFRNNVACREHSPQHNRPADEDALLLANRKRLLARSDWLHLDATRPLRMRFPSYGDKHRVGKRRKINQTSQQPKPAQKRELSPLFQHDNLQMPYRRDEVLPQEECIHIKIGTEALASQTQRSHSLHTRESRQFSPISEESMLLDADDEMPLLPMGLAGVPDPSVSVAAFAGSQMTRPFVPSELLSSSLSSRQCSELQPSVSQHVSSNHNRYSPSATLSSTSHQTQCSSIASQQDKNEQPVPDENETRSVRRQVDDLPLPKSCNAAHANTALSDDDDDESTWRMLMHIKPLASTGGSVSALKSSSQHITNSDISHKPWHSFDVERLNGVEEQENEEVPQISTPRGLGTLRYSLQPDREPYEVYKRQPSPSTSLQQIVALAERRQPKLLTHHKPVPEEDPDDDGLWRRFIIGSDDGQSKATQDLPGEDAVTNALPIHNSSDFLKRFSGVNDYAYSNAATASETLFVTGNTSPVAHLLNKQNRSRGTGSQLPSTQPTNMDDTFRTENIQPSEPRKPTNIHAPAIIQTMTVREACEKRKASGLSRRKGVYHPAPREQKPARERSVYDLLDSEGNFLD